MTTAAPAVHRTATRLSDGRELIYFDERPRVRDDVDLRGLTATSCETELRYDDIRGQWVGIAGHRQERTHRPAAAHCPLCPSSAANPTEIPAADYDVVVFENRFPAFADPGRCEVVCFADDHEVSFVDLAPSRVATILAAWTDRTAELSRRPDVEQVFVFENRGAEIGVTLSHPHGQIYGYPVIPPRTERALASAAAYRERTGEGLFDAVLAREIDDGRRIVRRSAHWTAFVPAAARWPFEIHMYPNERVADLTELTPSQRADFPVLYLDILRRLDAVYGVAMPYVAAWHQAPTRTGRDLAHLYLELFSIRRAPDKLKYLAGSESAMGMFVNDVAPERAAALLRGDA